MTGKFVNFLNEIGSSKLKWLKIKKLDKNQKAHLGYLGRDWFNLLCPGGCSASSSALLTTCSILIVRLAIIIRYSCCSIMPFFSLCAFYCGNSIETNLIIASLFSGLKNCLQPVSGESSQCPLCRSNLLWWINLNILHLCQKSKIFALVPIAQSTTGLHYVPHF